MGLVSSEHTMGTTMMCLCVCGNFVDKQTDCVIELYHLINIIVHFNN